MSSIKISRTTFEFLGSDLEVVAAAKMDLYWREFQSEFMPRKITVSDKVKIPNGKRTITFKLSLDFNEVSIVIRNRIGRKAEILKASFDDIIPVDALDGAVQELEDHRKAISNDNYEMANRANRSRTQMHDKITAYLKDYFDKKLPGLIVKHQEARNLAGVIRCIKHTQKLGPYLL